MKKITQFILIGLFWWIGQSTSFSQTLSTDVSSLNDRAWDLRDDQPDSAIILATQALKIAQQEGNQKGISFSYNIIGLSYKSLRNYEPAKKHFDEAIIVRKAMKDTLGVASIYNNLCYLQAEHGYHLKAIKNGFEAVRIYESYGTEASLAKAYANLADAYYYNDNYSNAIEYNKKSYNINKDLGDSLAIIEVAIDLATNFLNAGQLDSAVFYNQEALHLAEVTGQSDEMAIAYQALSEIYLNTNRFEAAKELTNRSIRIYQKNNDSLGLSYPYLTMSKIFLKEEKHQQALDFCNQVKAILGTKANLNDLLSLNQQYTSIYAAMGDYENAFIHQKKAANLDDRLYTRATEKAITEISTKYKTEKLERVNAEEKLKNQKKTTQRNTLFVISLALLFSLLGAIYYFRQRQRLNNLKVQIHQQQMDELLKAQELAFISARIEGQENERERLSRELHDHLGSMMVSTKWHYNNILEKTPQDNQMTLELKKANGLFEKTYQELRRIAYDISTGNVKRIGMVPALEDLCNTISIKGKMKTKLTTHGLNGPLGDTIEIAIYRIIQELISNVLKHAQASKIDIQVNQFEQEINIMVEDDGQGFDPVRVQTTSMGLRNIEGRVSNINGTLDIDSGKGVGTTVVINIPIETIA